MIYLKCKDSLSNLPPIPSLPTRWVWDELKSIADLRFRFQEEDDAMDYVSGIAATMPLYR